MGSSDARQTEVLVIGAGPAGIAAASVAAEHGRKVLVLSNSKWLGGQIWRGEEPSQARHWLNRLRASGAEVLTEATAVAAPASHRLAADTLSGP
ncbi:MAG TPA: FAD-dependent oxidoreductase, partial [Terriglobales bacterium]|nr:FAD-dependent oxidoreductase [Terriglobales bacterium]